MASIIAAICAVMCVMRSAGNGEAMELRIGSARAGGVPGTAVSWRKKPRTTSAGDNAAALGEGFETPWLLKAVGFRKYLPKAVAGTVGVPRLRYHAQMFTLEITFTHIHRRNTSLDICVDHRFKRMI